MWLLFYGYLDTGVGSTRHPCAANSPVLPVFFGRRTHFLLFMRWCILGGVFLFPLLPRKHPNPLMSRLRARPVCSDARLSSLPEVLGSNNPFKNSLQGQIATWTNTSCWTTHVLQFLFPNMASSRRLLSHLMGTAFTFAITAHCGLILLAARRQNRS